MTWYPHVTVATVIEKDNQFLLVHEFSENQLVYNQPAGHLEPNESLQQAAIRETLEETGWEITLTGFLGISVYTSPYNQVTYVRNTFIATPQKRAENFQMEDSIKDVVWLTHEQIMERQSQLRSPIVLKVIEDYRMGRAFPLDMVNEHR